MKVYRGEYPQAYLYTCMVVFFMPFREKRVPTTTWKVGRGESIE